MAAAVSLAGMVAPPPDPARVADAFARYQACRAPREFRGGCTDACLTAPPDAAFELCDAILCADQAVTSLAELSLVPAFRRGYGALYDALAAGPIDGESSPRCWPTTRFPAWSKGTRAAPGPLSMTGSTTACWSRP